jgi:hypothetical protein
MVPSLSPSKKRGTSPAARDPGAKRTRGAGPPDVSVNIRTLSAVRNQGVNVAASHPLIDLRAGRTIKLIGSRPGEKYSVTRIENLSNTRSSSVWRAMISILAPDHPSAVANVLKPSSSVKSTAVDEDFDDYTIEVGECMYSTTRCRRALETLDPNLACVIVVYAEMTKVVLLKADMLRNHLAVQELTPLGMDGVIKELSGWHKRLPEPMRLYSLFGDACPPPVRRSIYHVHLLYHGAAMLAYRCVAAHCARLQRSGGDITSTSREPALRSLVEQGITSAQDTARIVSLPLSDQGVFKRCSIVM